MITTNVSKTKVFGTYSIIPCPPPEESLSDSILIDNKHFYQSRHDSISEMYNTIYSSCCLDYEISKSESIKERTERSGFKGKGEQAILTARSVYNP